MSDNEYFLFPALLTSVLPLHESHKSCYCCGWLVLTVEHQFLTTQFLHACHTSPTSLQSHDDISTKTEAPGVKCWCKKWKNGITWHDGNGVSTTFEVRDLVLSMTCMDDSTQQKQKDYFNSGRGIQL